MMVRWLCNLQTALCYSICSSDGSGSMQDPQPDPKAVLDNVVALFQP